ncbi:MAG TPA: maleylpyruvate isomerase N-terminal domain-containing protein [Herpetosiphonaceae bacterium]
MDEQMTKAALLAALRAKRAAWDAVLAEVPEALMDEPGVAGEWAVKDIIAHLTYHERWYADRMHEVLRGESYVPNEMDRMDFDERNDRIYQQNRHRPAAEVLAESRQVFQRLIEATEAHAEEFLTQPQQFQGAPGPVIIWKMLRGDVYEHYGQHIPSIQRWLAARNG